MFRTILKKHSEEIFSNSMKGYARCAYCGKTILQSDKYCQCCDRARETVHVLMEVNEIKPNEDAQPVTLKPNIMYDPAIQIKKEDIQEAFKKAEGTMNMRSGGGAPGLKHHIPCPEKKGQRGDEEVDRRERHRRELGISTSKLNDMVERIYELMCENEVTLIEAGCIIAELGHVISEAEKRSPNTRLSEIPRFSKTWN